MVVEFNAHFVGTPMLCVSTLPSGRHTFNDDNEVQDLILHGSIAILKYNVPSCDLCKLFYTSITDKLHREGVEIEEAAWNDSESPVILRGIQYQDENYEARGLCWVKIRCDRLSPRAYCYFSFYPATETPALDDVILGRRIKPPIEQLDLMREWDAVIITRAVGVQYLWIDSLCIIQDSKEDWELESRRHPKTRQVVAL
ncbi:hypothetical protein EsH8_II_001534 [Colletotrichum jinshuiense]